MGNYRLFDYYQVMEGQNVALAFKGSISDKLLVGMAEIIKNNLPDRDGEQKVIQKVFSIFVELAQNIGRYSADMGGRGIIAVEDHRDFYEVKAGNLIGNSEIRTLREKIEHINTLDSGGLRKLYNKQLKAPRRKGRIGGNVGLISIVRESGNPIGITADPMGAGRSFVEISVRINKQEVV